MPEGSKILMDNPNTSYSPANNKEQVTSSTDEELIRIIDESGKGFGFDLTPANVAKPLGLACLALFGAGLAGGIPAGLALGWSESDRKDGSAGSNRKPDSRAQLSALKFATKALAYGTLLCGAFGVLGVYGIHRYFEVDSIEEFGNVMKVVVPQKRKRMEESVGPWLDAIRTSARNSLPVPFEKLRENFLKSRIGGWIKNKVEDSVQASKWEEVPTSDKPSSERRPVVVDKNDKFDEG